MDRGKSFSVSTIRNFSIVMLYSNMWPFDCLRSHFSCSYHCHFWFSNGNLNTLHSLLYTVLPYIFLANFCINTEICGLHILLFTSSSWPTVLKYSLSGKYTKRPVTKRWKQLSCKADDIENN